MKEEGQIFWDLDYLYSGVDDPKIDQDLSKIKKLYKKLSKFKNKLSDSLGKALLIEEQISQYQNKVFFFLYLKSSADQNDQAVKTKMQEVELKVSKWQAEYASFFAIELAFLSNQIFPYI